MSILMELYQLILKIRRSKGYESLAPISNIKKSATLDMLINAVGDSKNYNIALLGKYGAGKSSIRAFSEAISPEQFLDSSMDYNKVKDSKIYIHNYRGYGFTETEIFEYFGGKEKFLERANNIAKRPEIEIEKLIIENEKYEKEKDDLEKKPFYELFTNDEEIGINNNLIKMLLMNGYIDESYQDYMFVFKETEEINKNDYTYISNVRQHINSKYSYPIKNVEKVVEQLNENFFGTEPILNYNVIDFLITNENEGIKEKQHYCLSMLSELDKNKENFILGFIKYAKNGVEFLTKLYNENNNVIYEILINNSDKIDKTELIIKNILNIPEILNYDKTNNFIRSYIEEKKDLSSWIELNENVEKSLKILNVKFGNLEENDTNLLKFIQIKFKDDNVVI